MTNAFSGTALGKVLGLCSIFVLGALTHWGYWSSQERGAVWQGPAATSVADSSTQKASVAVLSEIPLAWPSRASQGAWRAVDEADEAAVRAFFSRQKQTVGTPEKAGKAAVVASEMARLAGSVTLPVAPVFPVYLLTEGREKQVEYAITRVAAVGEPVALDLKGLAIAAMHTRILETELSLVALDRRLTRRMSKLRMKLMRLAANEIDRNIPVEAPGTALYAGLLRSIDRAARQYVAAQPIAKKPVRTAEPVQVASANTTASIPAAIPGGAVDAIAAAARAGLPVSAPLPPERPSPQLLAYAPLPDNRPPAPRRAVPEETLDLTGVREAIYAYRKGEMESGDAHASRAQNEVARAAVEWAALRLQPRKAGYRRIAAFLKTHPDWPKREWLLWRAEQSLFIDAAARKYVGEYLAITKPVSPIGRLMQARYLRDRGEVGEAARIVKATWREERFNKWLERLILKEFGSMLDADDYSRRADRHFYRERYTDSLRIAAKAGKDAYQFAAARVAVARGAAPEKFVSKFEARFRKDPSWTYAKVRRLRKAEKPQAAAKVLLSAGPFEEEAVNAAAWWLELRMVARRLLDEGDAKTAYAVVARHRSRDGASLLDAEFYAGWIALRFLKKPDVALGHFSRSLLAASTPISRSRAAYWQARAAEHGPEPEDAERLYALAAEHSSTYYGQLAYVQLRGASPVPIRRAIKRAHGPQRILPIRVVELFKSIDEDSLAMGLASGLAKTVRNEAQIAALGAIMRRERDASGSLVVGKLASYRGIEIDEISFPDFGVPAFSSLSNSADKALVYAIARQESAFRARAVSHAGAKGLMQMLTSTARRTAQRKGIAFDPGRLVNDPAFNAQLGAAHIGELMDEHPGSLILVIAAYNAGGPRVNQWIRAYGDPRKPGVDPIDWVERIPISETRNYVQRVTENIGVYRSMMGSFDVPHLPVKDLRAYASRLP